MLKYNKILKAAESVLGDQSTTDRELTDLGRKLFGQKYLGTFASDAIPVLENGECCIVNVDASIDGQGRPLGGSHWMAMAKVPEHNQALLYDSFGRDTKILNGLGFSSKKKYIESDPDPEQLPREQNCGARSIAWLCYLDKYGPDAALKI